MGKKKRSNGLKYLNFAVSFGLTLAITIYLLFKGGMWLDQRLGTEPVFMMLGIFLAVATVFRQLIRELKNFEQSQKPDKEDH
jgi:F0F1-type ATP synthase assembly protein I